MTNMYTVAINVTNALFESVCSFWNIQDNDCSYSSLLNEVIRNMQDKEGKDLIIEGLEGLEDMSITSLIETIKNI